MRTEEAINFTLNWISSLKVFHSYFIDSRVFFRISYLLSVCIGTEEAINFTQNRISSLKVLHFLLYRWSSVLQDQLPITSYLIRR